MPDGQHILMHFAVKKTTRPATTILTDFHVMKAAVARVLYGHRLIYECIMLPQNGRTPRPVCLWADPGSA